MAIYMAFDLTNDQIIGFYPTLKRAAKMVRGLAAYEIQAGEIDRGFFQVKRLVVRHDPDNGWFERGELDGVS